MTRVTDFNNTWCEPTEENEKALSKNNIYGFGVNTKDTEMYLIKEDQFIPTNKNNFELGYRPRQIKLIDNDFYYVDEEKEEDSFNKLGFETPEFEGEILSKTEYKPSEVSYVGYVVKDDIVYPMCWNYKGEAYDMDSKILNYNLTPIKKHWYENEDNFPCVVLDKNYNMYIARGIDIDGFLLKEFNKQIAHVKHFRPGTKEEVLKLVIEEN